MPRINKFMLLSQFYILRVRAVAKACCEAYMAEVAGVNENADQEGEVA